MSLYIRLMTGFWSHRKTAKLRSLIGDDAMWVPLRLWCYAAENQPDGCFKQYSSTELAMLLGYSKDAQAMLEALQHAGFMDGMEIHGWSEHNAFHQQFSDKAKKAAAARWAPSPQTPLPGEGNKKGKDSEQALLEHACSIKGFEDFWLAYPKRKGKGDAEASWKRQKCHKLLEQILTAIRRAKSSPEWKKDNGQFIPYPATWLNRKGWDDDIVIPSRPKTNGAIQHEELVVPNLIEEMRLRREAEEVARCEGMPEGMERCE